MSPETAAGHVYFLVHSFLHMRKILSRHSVERTHFLGKTSTLVACSTPIHAARVFSHLVRWHLFGLVQTGRSTHVTAGQVVDVAIAGDHHQFSLWNQPKRRSARTQHVRSLIDMAAASSFSEVDSATSKAHCLLAGQRRFLVSMPRS